jgi:hypothetical protein
MGLCIIKLKIIMENNEQIENGSQNEDVVVDNMKGEEVVMDKPQKKEKSSSKKRIIITAVVVAVLIVFGALMYNAKKAEHDAMGGASNVIATVNGEKIMQSEYDTIFAQLSPQFQASNTSNNPDAMQNLKNQIVDSLINDKLLLQNAAKNNVSVTSDEVDTELQSIVDRLGGADKFNAQLQQEGITEAGLREDIQKQLVIQKYILSNVDLNSINVTDEEISSYYDQVVESAQEKEGIPDLDDGVKQQIKGQLIQQKQQQAVQEFIAFLRSSADIKTSL